MGPSTCDGDVMGPSARDAIGFIVTLGVGAGATAVGDRMGPSILGVGFTSVGSATGGIGTTTGAAATTGVSA